MQQDPSNRIQSLWLIYDCWDKESFHTESTDSDHHQVLQLNSTGSKISRPQQLHAWNMARQPCFLCRLYCKVHVLFDTYVLFDTHEFLLSFFYLSQNRLVYTKHCRIYINMLKAYVTMTRVVLLLCARQSSSVSKLVTLSCLSGKPNRPHKWLIAVRL